MSLNIKNPETHRRAKELARLTGETMTGAIDRSVRERLNRLRRPATQQSKIERLRKIAREVAAMPVLDSRPPDEMIYDSQGLPK